MKIMKVDVDEEADYLRKRRLQRRYNIKQAIIQRRKKEENDKLKAKRDKIENPDQPPPRQAIFNSCEPDSGPKTSKELNEIFKQCFIPEMHRIIGKAKSKINTGLDEPLNDRIA